MDFQLILATIGLGVLVFVGVFILFVLADLLHCEAARINKGDGYILRLFGFGVVYAKEGTLLQSNLNKVRKSEGKRWFITAPKWFNQYVANVGGVK